MTSHKLALIIESDPVAMSNLMALQAKHKAGHLLPGQFAMIRRHIVASAIAREHEDARRKAEKRAFQRDIFNWQFNSVREKWPSIRREND